MMSPSIGASGALCAFQDRFAEALFAPSGSMADSPEIARLVAQPGFAVYRNTVMKGCIDALEANYPAVSRLVGGQWFRAAAAIYARSNLPRRPSLLDYGRDFADFLDDFEPAGELPYLADVARLDRFWTEAHIARDRTPVAVAAVALLTAPELANTILWPHPSARWVWFDEQPIVTIWERNRMPETVESGQSGAPQEIDWHAEGVLIARPKGTVEWVALARGGCVFLDVCASGGTLADAATAALEVDPHVDLAVLMASMLAAGAFARLTINDEQAKAQAR